MWWIKKIILTQLIQSGHKGSNLNDNTIQRHFEVQEMDFALSS